VTPRVGDIRTPATCTATTVNTLSANDGCRYFPDKVTRFRSIERTVPAVDLRGRSVRGPDVDFTRSTALVNIPIVRTTCSL